MTRQEIFETVAKHLLKQGRQSKITSTSQSQWAGCMYRGPDGTSCAVGCLIPDDKYNPNMEEKNVQFIIAMNYGLDKTIFNEKNLDILMQLQWVHDTKANWQSKETLKAELTKVAVRIPDLDSKFLDHV